MKNLAFIPFLFLLFAACGEKGGPAGAQTAKPAVSASADSASIADALHTFFTWYGANYQDLTYKINFINEEGKYPTLDKAKLAEYLAAFMKSGVVSTTLVENETKYYLECAESWKSEEVGDVLSCMDYNRYYCGQDWDEKEFMIAPVKATISGDHASVQLLLDPNGLNGGPRAFEMKKENGKWLLSKIGCE